MNILKNNFISLIIIAFVFLLPQLSLAQDSPDDKGLVPCGNERSPMTQNADGTVSGGDIKNPCGLDDLLKLINKVVNFLLFTLALPLSAIMFAWAGFLFMFSGVQPEQRTKAKSIMWNVAFGLVIAVAAWLIINTILSIVGFKGDWTSFNF